MADKKKNKNDNFDLKAFLTPYLEKWYYFLISAIIFIGLGFVYTKTRSPQFQVNANVLITQEDNGGIGALADFGSLFGTAGDVDDEIFVLTSHYVYLQTAHELGLNIMHYSKPNFLRTTFQYRKYPVQIQLPELLADTLTNNLEFKVSVNKDDELVSVSAEANQKHDLGEIEDAKFPVTIETEYGPFVFDKTDFFPVGEKFEKDLHLKICVRSFAAAAESLAQEVEANIANKRTHVIGLSIVTPAPDYGIDVLNTMLNVYNKRGIDNKNQQNEKTNKFIEDRLVKLLAEIQVSDTLIQRFKENHDIMNIQWDSEFTYKIKGETQIALIEAKTKSEILKMAYDFVSNPKNAYDVMPSVTDNSKELSSAIDNYNQLILKRIEMIGYAHESNVALSQLTSQIDAMRESIIVSLKKAYENSVVAVKDLQQQVDHADASLGNLPQIEHEFANLYRESTVKAQLYQYLLRQHEETAMMLANAVPKGEIIDEAYVSTEPVGMSNKVIYFAFFLLGLGAAAGLIYLRMVFKSKFNNRSELEKASSVPIIGEIGTTHCDSKLIVGNESGSSNAELFRLMRANLQFILNEWDDKVVLVTSTQAGEGKSFISLNLAASFAILKKKVLLVGMDIRKPRLAEYLGLDSSKGLTNYLSTPRSDINDYIQRNVEINGLDVIVAGPVPPNPAELLSSENVDRLFDHLREIYDYIIVDTAPIGMVADTFSLNRISNATIYVTRFNKTTLRDLNFIDEIYTENRLKKLSVVINGVNLKKKGYGYGYGYGEQKKKITKD